MFKSVFTKYIVTFTLIIGVSFLVLVLTLSSIISNYMLMSNETMMNRTAKSVQTLLEDSRNLVSADSVSELFAKRHDELYAYISALSGLSSSAIYITDTNGILLYTSDENYEPEDEFLTSAYISTIMNDTEKFSTHKLGIFDSPHMNVFRTINDSDGTPEGMILVSVVYSSDTQLSRTMTGAILTASLWIFLAALITVYILSQRIIDPLKQLSSAAKSFAMGNFKERVKVSGHDEVAELTSAFNNMAASLEKNEEMRNSFLGNVSHDLRTPMTVISGFVDGIRDGTIPPEKHDYYLEVISTEVRRLSRLVNSLLEISRMQSGERQLNITSFNVTEKARQVLLSFEQKISDKRIEIEFDCGEDTFVSADTDAVHQIFYNLLDNAVKFTPENGTISICIKSQDKKARITVKNSGDGIPADELPYIFDRFYKSDRSRGLDKMGTGLGLYIVKTNVNMHNEDIKAESRQGEYTAFTFTLPL